MKKTLVLFAIPCALLCAADQKTQKSQKNQTPSKPAAAKTATVQSLPAGAVEVEPYLYRFQDADGKKWLFRQTPFGIVKMKDEPAAVPVVDNSNPVVVTDQGATVKFEKKTPFGVQSWTRKKAELSDSEKSMVQDSLHGAAAPVDAAGKAQTSRNAEKQ